MLPEKTFKKLKESEAIPVPPKNVNLIYDFGGKADARVVEALEVAEVIVVPFYCSSVQDLHAAAITLAELKNHVGEKNMVKVVGVLNRARKGDENALVAMQGKFPKVSFLKVNESTLLSRLGANGQSLDDVLNDPLLSYSYRGVAAQLKALNEKIMEVGNGK
jgi:hypothetical protein